MRFLTLRGSDSSWLNPRKEQLMSWRQSFAQSLERRGIPAKAIPAYSSGHKKESFRRDLEELRLRGTRKRPKQSPSFDPDKEALAIQNRAGAWSRLAGHFGKLGDRELESKIKNYVSDHFDYHHPGDSQQRDSWER